jgi:CMP-N-acetylneuraminic acid synthetase
MRPARHATDDAAGASVWRHAWLAAEKHYGMRFDLSVYLQPTTPIRHAREVEATLRTMVEGGYAAATTVSPVPGHFTPQKILTLEGDGRLGFYLPEGHVVARQHAPRYWYRNGLCYAAVRAQVAGKGHIMEGAVAGVPIERPVVNIDEPVELLLADALWREEHTKPAPKAKTKPKAAAKSKPQAKAKPAPKPKAKPTAKPSRRKT